jgi:uncharacterized membrane protein
MSNKAMSVPTPTSRGWSLVTPILAVLGIGISGYLSYVKLSATQAVCLGLGECETVQNSPYSVILGIPIAILGLLTYLAIIALWWWSQDEQRPYADMAPMILFGITLFGFLYSVYLTYLELFVLKAICPWCVASAILMTVLMIINARQALNTAS